MRQVNDTSDGGTFSSSTFSLILWKLAKTSVIAGASVAAIGLAALYVFQSKVVYPAGLNGSRDKVSTPDEYGLPYQSVDIHTDDGETLKSYLLLHDSTSPDYSNKTILVLSPNAGNIGNFLPVVKYIYEVLNYNVFIYSYRGYGHSTGTPSEKGLKLDADAVIKYIEQSEQLSRSSVVCYGRSIGGAVAIYIVAKYPTIISGLILDNTFLSIRKVIPYLFPFLRPFTFLCHEIWPSEDYMKTIPAGIPVLFLSAGKDEIVPPSHMQTLYDISKSSSKTWKKYKNAHHNDTITFPKYWEDFAEFMTQQVTPIGK
ncbi:hypothetical protein BRETT_004221 [Brettanomyces bruxellensis]|uniref:AB hydrolase-1 domain-containing protein n=1 Tax=Dekkera bruxellensis TaxID=5007 RepID=A0A871RA52_DEKBR|nr:uncharacterized protein BRETT_004221 [Brettanomyces bruxellensis]QOU19000.1 hypothetical protein BRETT_004221 [Brettanomyces bruxellensis]